MENAIIGLIGCLFFVIGLINKKSSVKILIFFIPFEVGSFSGFGLPGIMVLCYFVGNKLSELQEGKSIPALFFRKYIFLIWLVVVLSILAFIINTNINDLRFGFDSSINKPFFRYMLNFFASIAFYSLLTRVLVSYQDIIDAFFIFSASAFYVFITWLGSFKFDWPLPGFMHTMYSGSGSSLVQGSFERFAGYTGEYGLMSEYFFIVLIFSSFLFVTKNKKYHIIWSIIIFTIAIPMALSTGTRAFIFVFFIFLVTLFLIFFRKGKIRLKQLILSIGLVLSLTIIVVVLFSEALLFERLQESTERTQKINYLYDIDIVLNRPYFSEFDNVIEVGGLFGVGPLNIIGVRGNEMALHSLYYDFIIKFGILGFFIYMLFYSNLIRTLYTRILRNKDGKMIYLGITLFALFISLLIGEYARSYQNQTSFMLMYWFLFSLISIYVNLPDDKKLKTIS